MAETVCNVGLESCAIAATPETHGRPATIPPDLRERCKLLYFQGFKLEMIASETGVKRGTLRTWCKRYGWNNTVAAGKQIMVARGVRVLSREATTQLDGQSARLRKKLADVIEKGADALQEVTVKATPKAVRKLGEAIETLTRSAKIVHSWGSEGPVGIVLGDLLGAEHDRQSSIEITADVAESPCVQDTPTSSVPAIEQSAPMPQVAQEAEAQPDASQPN